MKITLTTEEMTKLIKKSLPAEFMPEGYEVSDVVTSGYPINEFTIKLDKKEE